MCEANAYLMEGDKEELVMESVDLIEPEGTDMWRLVDIFGEQRTLRGRIRRMELVDHKIVFETSTD
jgi:predicted RNA-binding protein